MPFSNVLQLNMPSLFPLKTFEEFVHISRNTFETGSEARHEFGRASNIIGWRFRACVEDKENYMESWKLYGSNDSFEERYFRERFLFGIFVSGLSCIEATVYSCYALASDPNVFGLPFNEKIRQYSSGLGQLKEKLKAIDSSITLVSALEDLITSDEWSLWKEFRNAMTHRGNIPRMHYAGTNDSPTPEKPLEFAATWSTRALSGDDTFFNEQLHWLSNSLNNLFYGGIKLAQKY